MLGGCSSRMLEKPSKYRGFTLLELIVTLLVAGVLTSLAVPTVGNILHQTRLNRVVDGLHGDMVFARSEAVKRRLPISVLMRDTKWVNGWRVFVDLDSDGAIDTGEEILRNFLPTYNTDGTGVQTEHTHTLFTYNDRGVVVQPGGIAFTSSNSGVKVKTVRMEFFTQPRVCYSDETTATSCKAP